MKFPVIEVFSNCYGAYGVQAAISHAGEIGLSHVEISLAPHQMGEVNVPAEAIITEKSDQRRIEGFQKSLHPRLGKKSQTKMIKMTPTST